MLDVKGIQINHHSLNRTLPVLELVNGEALIHILCYEIHQRSDEKAYLRRVKHLRLLLQDCPSCVDCRTLDGTLPIEICIKRSAPVEILGLLLEICSISARELQDICRRYYCPFDIEDALLLQVAVSRSCLLKTCNIHICGDGRVGKSTLCQSLVDSLSNQSSFSYYFKSTEFKSNIKSTTGMENYSVEYGDRRYILRDYGGQEEFHVNHSAFLGQPGSVYIIVVPICNSSNQYEIITNNSLIRQRYLYWLKYIYSVANRQAKAYCLTVVNTFKSKLGGEHFRTAEILEILDSVRRDWISSSAIDGMCFADAVPTDTFQFKSVWKRINVGIDEAINFVDDKDYHVNVSASVKKILDVKSSWPPILKRESFDKDFVLPVIRELNPTLFDRASSLCKASIVETVTRSLETLYEILPFVGDENGNNSWVIIDLNWLTRNLLGRIAESIAVNYKDMCSSSGFQILSFDQTIAIAKSAFQSCPALNVAEISDFFLHIPLLLVNMGVCVRDGTMFDHLWFSTNFSGSSDCDFVCSTMVEKMEVLRRRSFGGFDRCIIRMFQLGSEDVFPPGYFMNLFSKVRGLFDCHCSLQLCDFAMQLSLDIKELKKAQKATTVLVTIMRDRFNDEWRNSFKVTVQTLVDLAMTNKRQHSETYAWKLMTKICGIISVERSDLSNVASQNKLSVNNNWIQNIRLKEFCVSPDFVQSATIAMNTVIDSDLLSMKCYYGISRGETYQENCTSAVHVSNKIIFDDAPHDNEDPTLDCLEKMMESIEKVNTKLDSLDARLSTVNVTSDIISDSFKCMMKTLDQTLDGRLQNMIERALLAAQQEILVLSDKTTIGESESTKHLQYIQASVDTLLCEVKTLQQLDIKLQQCITKSVEQSRSIRRMDQMLHMVLKNQHDVPTLAVVLPTNNSSKINPRNWVSIEYTLFFVCSHSFQVVPCGPTGYGYKFRKSMKWFRKVAPVIKISLIVAQIALNLSGVPIPIFKSLESALSESEDWLSSAISLTELASETNIQFSADLFDNVDGTETLLTLVDSTLMNSDSVKFYKTIENFLNKYDKNRNFLGMEKIISDGEVRWVKNDPSIVESFKKGEKWPLKIKEFGVNHLDSNCSLSQFGLKNGLWIPSSLLHKDL